VTVADDSADIVRIAAAKAAPDRYIHSDIFERLVADQDDLAGLVAYGLYQRRKRQWIDREQARKSCLPSEAEVRAYSGTFEDGALSSLKREAEQVLSAFAEDRIIDRFDDIQEGAFNARAIEELSNIKSDIKSLKSMRHHILGHIIGFMSLVAIYVLITIAVEHEPSIRQVFNWILGRA
jgi:hypothetical protein